MDPRELIGEILSTGKTGMIAGAEHTIEWVSDAARLLLQEVTGDEIDLVGSDWFGLTPAEARPADDLAFTQALQSGSSDWYLKTCRIDAPDGEAVFEVEAAIIKRRASPFKWLAMLRVSSADTTGTSLTGNVRARVTATMQLARRLTGCTTQDEVLQVIDRLAAPALAADTVSVTFLDEGWTHADPALGSDYFADLDDHIDVDTSVGAAWKMRRTIIVSDVDALAERYPTTIKRMACANLVTYAAMPMLDREGEVFGVLHCGWRRRSWIDVAHLEGLGEMIGNALYGVRTSERQREIAAALQGIMLPRQPGEIEGCTVATRYQPIEALVGGDFYDVVERGDHVWFIVGDVSGHGLEAARTMGKARFFIRAVLGGCQRPSQVLRAASQLLVDERGDELATCAVALWDRGASILQVATAANVAPLIADSRGVRYIEVDPLPPLGIVLGEVPEQADALVPVTSSAQLLMFTDGLVERRDGSIDESLEHLRATIESGAWTAHQVVAQLLEPLLSSATDDVAVLCADLRPRRERA